MPSCASGQPADNVIKIPVQVFLSKERKDLVKEHHLLLQLNESELCHLHTVHQGGIHRLRSAPKVSIFLDWKKSTFECLASFEGALAWALKGERKVAELKSKKRPLYGQRQERKSSGILRNDT